MPSSPTVTFFFDNGSLRPASTLNLRAISAALTASGCPVEAVSLLHSSGVPEEQLGGLPARLLEPAVGAWLQQHPAGEVVLLPFFFGASAALTDYVPDRMAALATRFPDARFRLAPELCPDPGVPEPALLAALEEVAQAALPAERWPAAHVVLVDHGTPQRAVNQVRNTLGAALAAAWQGRCRGVSVASMERRPGEAFAFNEPLLADRLRTAPYDEGDVLVLLQFLSPGRHAGPEGDIAQICSAAAGERPGLRTWISDTLGSSSALLPLLRRRWEQGQSAPLLFGHEKARDAL